MLSQIPFASFAIVLSLFSKQEFTFRGGWLVFLCPPQLSADAPVLTLVFLNIHLIVLGVGRHACGSERQAACRNQFSPCTMGVPGMELELSACPPSAVSLQASDQPSHRNVKEKYL